VISAPENSNKFKKTKFWSEKSIEDVVTLGPNSTGPLVRYECKSWQHNIV